MVEMILYVLADHLMKIDKQLISLLGQSHLHCDTISCTMLLISSGSNSKLRGMFLGNPFKTAMVDVFCSCIHKLSFVRSKVVAF